ncbi:MAG: hypothetical protein IKN57_07000 [Parasporobacterium sp.]|nr:hypothetical protein [Parasporobacterium sp.]
MMKKLFLMILLSGALLLNACGGKFTCALCQQEKSGKRHKTSAYGIEITVCDDCYKTVDTLSKDLGF